MLRSQIPVRYQFGHAQYLESRAVILNVYIKLFDFYLHLICTASSYTVSEIFHTQITVIQ